MPISSASASPEPATGRVATTLPSGKLSWRVKFVYGLGDWGAASATAARNLYWLYFIVSVVGVDIKLAGLAFIIGRIWDAVNDPLIGILSDRLRTRWGRRRPFLLLGALPFGVGFWLMFSGSPFDSQLASAFYYAAVFILYDTAYTIVNAPYVALTPELSQDYDERSSLAGWRMANSILASLVTAALFRLLAERVFAGWFSGPHALQQGYAVSGAIWGLIIVITPLLVFWAIREEPRPPDDDPLDFWQTFKDVLANRPFRIGATVYLLTFTAADIVTTVFVWFLVYYLGFTAPFDSVLLAAVLSIAFLTMPLTVWLMRRLGKTRTYVWVMSLWIAVMGLISLIPPGALGLTLLAALLAGFGYGAANAIPWAMVADVVEEDELRTGKRREGVYSGYLVTFRKIATAVAIAAVTQALAAAGFVAGTGGAAGAQPQRAILTLRLCISVAPAALLMLSIWAASRYPLTREAHADLRRRLAERRAADAG